MNRDEAKKILLEQLEKLPNREICRIATEEEIETIVKQVEIDVENTVSQILLVDNLYFKLSEIPKDKRFEAILYLALYSEEFKDFYILDDFEIWDLADTETDIWIEKLKRMLEIDTDLSCICLKDVLEYAKSSKPDF